MTEPVTTLTDYALAVASLTFAILLARLAQRKRRAFVWLWAGAFMATAVASAFGGTHHGFASQLGEAGRLVVWKIAVYAVGVVSMLMLSAAAMVSAPARWRNWVIGLALTQFLVYAAWMVTHNAFRYVVYDYVPAMLGVLLLHASAAYRRRDIGARWISAGVLVSFAGAAVQQTGFALHAYFNHNDLYHVIQLGALYLLYRGVHLLAMR